MASFGTVFPTGSLNDRVENTASGWSALGVAIGGEVVGADAQLTSGFIAGAFPGVSATAAAAARAAVPVSPYVPEPGFGTGLAFGGLGLAGLRWSARLRTRA